MSRVEIYRLKKGGTQEVVAEFSLVNNEAVGSGDEKFIERLKTDGVLDVTIHPPAKIYPADGVRFLNTLRSQFTSGYLIASEVLEDPPSEI